MTTQQIDRPAANAAEPSNNPSIGRDVLLTFAAEACKAQILAKEAKDAAEADEKRVKPQVEQVRLALGGKKQTEVPSTFRNVKGRFIITHVQQPGRRTVSVSTLEAMVVEGIIPQATVDALLLVSDPVEYNLVAFKKG